jgi:hypothetical protein
MEHNGHEIEFVCRRFPGQEQSGTDFRAIPKSIIQTSPGLTPGIFILHPV